MLKIKSRVPYSMNAHRLFGSNAPRPIHVYNSRWLTSSDRIKYRRVLRCQYSPIPYVLSFWVRFKYTTSPYSESNYFRNSLNFRCGNACDRIYFIVYMTTCRTWFINNTREHKICWWIKHWIISYLFQQLLVLLVASILSIGNFIAPFSIAGAPSIESQSEFPNPSCFRLISFQQREK